MNKIYKTVKNKKLNITVVASELCKNGSKCASGAVGAVFVTGLIMVFPAAVCAEDITYDGFDSNVIVADPVFYQFGSRALFSHLSASNNIVTIRNSGQFDLRRINIYGGLDLNGFNERGSSGNTVKIEGGQVSGRIYGGYSSRGDVTNNSIIVTTDINSSLGHLFGGYSNYGNVSENNIIIDGSNINIHRIYGSEGYQMSDHRSEKNTVKITNSTVDARIYGAEGFNHTIENSVNVLEPVRYFV